MALKIMLDMGHGGRDSGAVSGSRYEKNDVLRMGLHMAKILSASGAEVQCTRISDIYETPYQKAEEGNAFHADVFVSMHRNSAADKTARGFETLTYNNTGKALEIANLANAKMASVGFRNRGAKQRPDLVVLNSTKMQAVLFETGFISNAEDNELFDKHFDRISRELCASVLEPYGMKVSGAVSTTPPVSTPKPEETRFIDVAYQVYADGRWLPVVHNMEDFAGIENAAVKGIRVWTVGRQEEVGNVKYRVHLKGRPADEWLDWMVDRQKDKYGDDFAGNLRDEIEAVQMVLINCPGRVIQYRTSRTSDNNYYAFVTNTQNEGGYAGVFGRTMDKLQVRVA